MDTRPTVGTAEDYAKWHAEREDIKRRLRGDGVRIMNDGRLTSIITWVAAISSVLTAALLTAFFNKFWQMSDSLIEMKGAVNSIQQTNTFQNASFDRRLSSVETKVDRIESRQVESINKRAGP